MVSVSLLGVPNDDNSSFLKGPAAAPAHIRRALWSDASNAWSETGIDLGVPGRVVDRGDVEFDGTTDPWVRIDEAVSRGAALGGPTIFLGGDHAITHPIVRALRRHHASLTILHIDAHPDIYDSFQGNPRSHASPFARIMEERLAERLVQVGVRTVSAHQREQFVRFGVDVIEAGRWEDTRRLELATPVYVSIDLDGLDPACAPGVSHREPGGPTTRQVLDLLHSIRQPVIGADVVEYNPRCDISDMTAAVAAKLVKELAGIMLRG